MKYLISLFTILSPILAKANSDIVLSIGSKFELSVRNSDRIYLENSQLIRLNDKGRVLEAIGKKLGETQIFINNQPRNVYILKKQIFNEYVVIKNLLKNLKGLNVKIQNGKPYITGTLHRVSDWELLYKLKLKHYKFTPKVDRDIKSKTNSFITNILSENFIEVSKFNLSNGLKVYTDKKQPEKNITSIVNHLGGYLITTKKLLSIKPQVKVDIIIAEVNKSFSQTLGVATEGQLSAQLLPNLVDQSLISSWLLAAEHSGEGQILARPSLLCKSGKSASFLAGGEIPIKVLKADNHSILWKRYGVQLKISPIIDALEQIDLKLSTEVSMIDASTTVDGVPAIKTTKVESHFNFSKPSTILISGLLKENKGSATEGLPFLSRIPILGKLFSSQSYINNKTELVIFVKTSIAKKTL